MSKQDATYARTAQDLERKYSFGKSFGEILGIVNDYREKVDSVESGLRNEITESETRMSRNTEQIVMQATATIENEVNEQIDGVNAEIETIKKDVSFKLNADEVAIAVKKEVSTGITLETGYTFDSDGMHINKYGDEMDNLLDNTGMYVKRGAEEVLTANKDGVNATDLHAKTYLIIGEEEGDSRFERYYENGKKRTGCFWVGN